MSRVGETVIFDFFEVAPKNQAVMSIPGRLRRRFPASSVGLPVSAFADDDLHASLAEAIAKMNEQEIAEMKAHARKAGRDQIEERDTTDPAIVTDFLATVLCSMGDMVDVPTITKNTREQICWKDAKLPWRRSPLWLFIRVTLQTIMVRTKDPSLYKQFMVFFMASVLQAALNRNLANDIIYCMVAKISGRLQKLERDIDYSWLHFVEDILKSAASHLRASWQAIVQVADPKVHMHAIRPGWLEEDSFKALPDLDMFINSVELRKSTTKSTDFSPAWSLPNWTSSALPILSTAQKGEKATFDVFAFEKWVAVSLDSWLKANIRYECTADKLLVAIKAYHTAAWSQYQSDPEGVSRMLLTIFELWVACDRSACTVHKLLGDYQPEIPLGVFESLILPFKSQMERLHHLEEYFVGRQKRAAAASMPSIFSSFGQKNSFAVRFFASSTPHQELKSAIESRADAEKTAKIAEFQHKLNTYNNHIAQSKVLPCEYYHGYNRYTGQRYTAHSKNCKKCQHEKDAAKIRIEVHEWPLPSSRNEAQNAVFELQVPDSFQGWRNATTYVILDVLKSSVIHTGAPPPVAHLVSYLQRYHSAIRSGRIVLASTRKSNRNTHRKMQALRTASQDDVLLANGLRYAYYDSSTSELVGSWEATVKMAKECTYQLSPSCASLQNFIFRPDTNPTGMTPNHVISEQSECPDHLSLEEFKAMAALPCGHRIQWPNLLAQLHMPTLDFTNGDMLQIALQILRQAGPRDGSTVFRDGHQFPRDGSFAASCLDGLLVALEKLKENWESYSALHCFIAVATRLLSLAPSDEVASTCLKFLTKCREVALKWLALLQDKAKSSEVDKDRMQFITSIISIAQISLASFDIDECYLPSVIAEHSSAAILVESAIIGHDAFCSAGSSEINVHQTRLRRILFKTSSFLATAIMTSKSPCLDMALHKTWAGYPGVVKWQTASHPHTNWLVASTASDDSKASMGVQYNILTGELLVNGFPLSRLPKKFESHPTYPVLFGKATMEVLPTEVPGMDFSSKKPHHGCSLFFGWNTSPSAELLLVAADGTKVYDLVPARVFADTLPAQFISDYVHWYDRSSQTIEFRGKSLPWQSRPETNWVMRKGERGWVMQRQGQHMLIWQKTETLQYVARLLRPLEDAMYLHLVLDRKSGTLRIEMPRLKLDFQLKSGSTKLWSRQFRGMYLDPNSNIGTLSGVFSKLVLRNECGDQKVLIPDGDPRWQWDASLRHTRTTIPYGTSKKVHLYDVDNSLQRLVDNGSLESKLVVCYLHALSSSCLPDNLTGKTGTEQALGILGSASLRSFEYLEEANVAKLGKIASLSPARVYYPPDLQSMESTTWDIQLSFLSQDNGFNAAVQSLFDQASATQMFYPGSSPKLMHLSRINEKLGQRQAIRAASFQVYGFGAENRTTARDGTYRSRDDLHFSDKSKRAFEIAHMMVRDGNDLLEAVDSNLAYTMWSFLHGTVAGLTGTLAAIDICYDLMWLSDQDTLMRSYWCQLYELLQASTRQSRFRALLCLSTMAYADTARSQFLQILAAVYKKSALSNVKVPSGSVFVIPDGRVASRSYVNQVAESQCIDFTQSDEFYIPQKVDEEDVDEYYFRRFSTFSTNKTTAVNNFVDKIYGQWLCKEPEMATGEEAYIRTGQAMSTIRGKWNMWYQNHLFHQYLEEIATALQSCVVATAPSFQQRQAVQPPWQPRTSKPYIDGHSLFLSGGPDIPVLSERELNLCRPGAPTGLAGNKLADVLLRLKSAAVSQYPNAEKYITELVRSLDALKKRPVSNELSMLDSEIEDVLAAYLCECQANVHIIYSALKRGIAEYLAQSFTREVITERSIETAASFMAPRMSTSILLENLSKNRWPRLSPPWQKAIVAYGVAVTKLQQAQRLSRLSTATDLIKELSNKGHTNWNPADNPEPLLLEIESGILIRDVQEDIARQMRAPPEGRNAVMQLNMGEGKSSVIVPIVAAALADGKKLIRVIVAKPQAKELFRTLVSKLGGLLNRRIYHMPFNRSLRLSASQVKALSELYKECRTNGGVILCQPEHLLSFKLMAIEYQSLEDRGDAGNFLLDLYHDFNQHSRDIVDESDENFSPKFELIYTMGVQRPIELSPDRWTILQRVLDIVAPIATSIYENDPESMEITHNQLGRFPRTRVLRDVAGDLLLRRVTQKICETGLPGLPIARQEASMREAIFTYIFEDDLSEDQIHVVERSPFFTNTTKDPLLLLRGLIAGRVLLFALKQKRWRVNYGLDTNRTPSTKLAVPYRAKDSPSPRSEFSHPDVVILLACLSHYYEGLSDEDLFTSLSHLIKADQSEIEYHEWVLDAPDLPEAFQSLGGINMKDVAQITTEVFPHLRYSKRAIDYFLSHLVFPKEMKEFSHKLSASGWDLGEQKRHATTGFSGTNDSQHMLPLDVKQLDIQEQLHTNALVLENLLKPENKVHLLQPLGNAEASVVDMLFNFIVGASKPVHVILDVGAQVLELTNVQVAKRWLQLSPADSKQDAVVYFDDGDDLCVIDRAGVVEKLRTSSYSDQLDRCLVFLDQAHTRGTDLKLPEDYRAAVTLGPDLTKDGLAQACMRMRKLGSGQSVVFCISPEMQFRVNMAAEKAPGSIISVDDVLMWAIHETHADLHRLMPLWAVQGSRFVHQKRLWNGTTSSVGISMSRDQAEQFLEEEAQTIEYRYRPTARSSTKELHSQLEHLTLDESDEISAIQSRCDNFGVSQSKAAALQEEQEKELAPEIEQERQIERPAKAEPALHVLHQELKDFITTGSIPTLSPAVSPAFLALDRTSMAKTSCLGHYPRSLLVTADYIRTVKLGRNQARATGVADSYQRPIQWILTGHDDGGHMTVIVISPFEANELVLQITLSRRAHLHIYAPRASLAFAPMDSLGLHAVPPLPDGWRLPENLRLELNLFAGQLYFSSFDDYRRTCNVMSIAWRPPAAGGAQVETDGFIASGVSMNANLDEAEGSEVVTLAKFDKSPVQSLKTLLMVLRRDSREIDKTHWGRVIAGELLTEDDFTEDLELMVGDTLF